ncbi:hypothetical protein C8J56DRAFT_1054137 [Mycena floridula]|nr:hypothetical protein C8J56DRAFT_1054137 [Mycena floridula]
MGSRHQDSGRPRSTGRRRQPTGNPGGRPRKNQSTGDSEANLPVKLRIHSRAQVASDDSPDTRISKLSADIDELQRQIDEQEVELYGPQLGADGEEYDPAVMSRPLESDSDELDLDEADGNSQREKKQAQEITKSTATTRHRIHGPKTRRDSETMCYSIRYFVAPSQKENGDDEDFSIAYRLTKDSKDTRNALDDANDFWGILDLVSRCRKGSGPLEIIIIDLNQAIVTGKSGGKSKSAKALQQAELVAKARGDAKEQTEIDDWILELKKANPKCPEHKSYCWKEHPSKVHVVMTDLRFRNWSTAFVKERVEFPDWEPTITLTKPPANRMFDPDQVGTKTSKPKAPDAASIMPNIVINMPNIPGLTVPVTPPRCCHSSLPPSSGGFEEAAKGDWPTLIDFLEQIGEQDQHKHDFTKHQAVLEENGLLGPDDIACCSPAELRDCGLTLGVAKILVSSAERVKKKVQADVKHHRIY